MITKIKSSIYKFLILGLNAIPKSIKLPFFSIIRDSRLPNNKFYRDLKVFGIFSVKTSINNFNIIGTGGPQDNSLFWKGISEAIEPETIWIWNKIAPLLNNVIDIGANIGIYSLLTKAIRPECFVIAFEPSRGTFSELCNNVVANNSDIKCEKIALSNKIGELTFYDSIHPHQTSASLSHRMQEVNSTMTNEVTPYNVHVETLDSYLLKNPLLSLDLIKIDVELHEREVFEGMTNTIVTLKPMLIFECIFQDIADELQSFLIKHDYVFFHLNGKTHPPTINKVENLTGRMNNEWNYFACPKDKEAEIFALINL